MDRALVGLLIDRCDGLFSTYRLPGATKSNRSTSTIRPVYVLDYRVPDLVLVGVLVGAVLGLVVALVAARRELAVSRLIGLSGLSFVVVFVLSVTLAPSGRSFSAGCSLALPGDIFSWTDDQRMLNLLLFVPLGLLGVLAAPNGRQRIAAPVALIGLSAALELLQVTTFVARSCDLTDVFDNSVGCVVGATAGALIIGGMGFVDHRRERIRPLSSQS